MNEKHIAFNKAHLTGNELTYIYKAYASGSLAGDGPFTHQCHKWLEDLTGCSKALLTHSCTAALEMAAILLDIQQGDEIIVPSYTFVSTANAFVLRGGIPVFIDIREDTMNIDERLIEDAITPKTRGIVLVHYAGVACEMDTITEIAKRHNLKLIEDSAQGMMASYKGRALGSIGHLGTFSFHETKNVTSGEGGALLINDPDLVLRAEIIREKGTDRSRFSRGEVDKYTWQDLGSSFLPGELVAAFLWAQLEKAESITHKRLVKWQYYHDALKPSESKCIFRRPIIPEGCQHNAHMYYVLLAPEIDRQKVLDEFKRNGISCVFHYVPLHSSPAGLRYGRVQGSLSRTIDQSGRLIRLPLWIDMTEQQQDRVIDILKKVGNFLY
jgi:dTDP-4-amino-4,6-dideoxygalactose transaminase